MCVKLENFIDHLFRTLSWLILSTQLDDSRVIDLRFCGVLCISRSVGLLLASLGRHAQLTRCFSAVAELLVISLIDWLTAADCKPLTAANDVIYVVCYASDACLAPSFHSLWMTARTLYILVPAVASSSVAIVVCRPTWRPRYLLARCR